MSDLWSRSEEESLCLKWNDHHLSFFSQAEQLCASNQLTDVTLSCGDKQYMAHKLVLSVCSGYFANLFNNFKNDSRSFIVVYMKDVSPLHMELLLTYMYRGQVNVNEADLPSLLETAKGLCIKGLTTTVSTTDDNRLQTSESIKKTDEDYHTIQSTKKVPTSLDASIPSEGMNENDTIFVPSETPANFDITEEQVYEIEYDNALRGFPCPICGRPFHKRSDLNRHMVVHTKKISYTCTVCDKEFKRRDVGLGHVKVKHPELDEETRKNTIVRIDY